MVRELVVANALFWIDEYHMDGLRLDAVHAILDDSPTHILDEIALRVRAAAGGRRIHLILENEENRASRLVRDPDGAPREYTAQWNDDLHHVLHTAVTGESAAYYESYHGDTEKLGRALAEGLRLSGRDAAASRDGARRAERGPAPDRLRRLHPEPRPGRQPRLRRAADGDRAAARPCAPPPQSIFSRRKSRCCSWARNGGRRGRSSSSATSGRSSLRRSGKAGGRSSRAFRNFRTRRRGRQFPTRRRKRRSLPPSSTGRRPKRRSHAAWRDFYRRVLSVRRAEIAPRLRGIGGHAGRYAVLGPQAVRVDWTLGDGSALTLMANFSARRSRLRPWRAECSGRRGSDAAGARALDSGLHAPRRRRAWLTTAGRSRARPTDCSSTRRSASPRRRRSRPISPRSASATSIARPT